MADKVQRILEDVLQESIYLVKKGIFSEGELKRQMTNRERFQNNLVSKTLRTIDFLKAIEYEYEQERIRRYRESQQSQIVIDPRYKRANTKDFTIVKRVIRLWDRTLHKYRFRIDLWKQYLLFCNAIGSRKAFYKALTNAVRFNPFQLELWMAGVYFELEIVRNPWRARKIFHKAIKINKRKTSFWSQYFRFECEFALLIVKRETGLAQDSVITFEGEGKNKQNIINFNGLLKEVIQAAIEAVGSEKKLELLKNLAQILKSYSETLLVGTAQQVLLFLEETIKQNSSSQTQVHDLLSINYEKYASQLLESLSTKSTKQQLDLLKDLQIKERTEVLNRIPIQGLKSKEKAQYFEEWSRLMKETNNINNDIIVLGIKELCFSSESLTSFLLPIIDIASLLILKRLLSQKVIIPSLVCNYYLDNYETLSLSTFEIDNLLKRSNRDYNNEKFLKSIINFNKKNNRSNDNLKLLKSIRISHPQILPLVSTLINQQIHT